MLWVKDVGMNCYPDQRWLIGRPLTSAPASRLSSWSRGQRRFYHCLGSGTCRLSTFQDRNGCIGFGNVVTLIEEHSKEVRRRKDLNEEQGYPEGSWVGIKAVTSGAGPEGSSSKFARRFSGPYQVIRRLPNGVPTKPKIWSLETVRKSTAIISSFSTCPLTPLQRCRLFQDVCSEYLMRPKVLLSQVGK